MIDERPRTQPSYCRLVSYLETLMALSKTVGLAA